ncbi:unnamed protein product [Parascedosporium putredinis]|uniref:Uncharacterized protein n=1 Tax=Parascedosporium putredinis TaxID=1442378 RepID=A0A9P1GV17_9PEZI|nr:unnamed protein product [Parascedosporium putredinis]CAI7988174.1 unnamed protein product [Parascedosporium putredinis]
MRVVTRMIRVAAVHARLCHRSPVVGRQVDFGVFRIAATHVLWGFPLIFLTSLATRLIPVNFLKLFHAAALKEIPSLGPTPKIGDFRYIVARIRFLAAIVVRRRVTVCVSSPTKAPGSSTLSAKTPSAPALPSKASTPVPYAYVLALATSSAETEAPGLTSEPTLPADPRLRMNRPGGPQTSGSCSREVYTSVDGFW